MPIYDYTYMYMPMYNVQARVCRCGAARGWDGSRHKHGEGRSDTGYLCGGKSGVSCLSAR